MGNDKGTRIADAGRVFIPCMGSEGPQPSLGVFGAKRRSCLFRIVIGFPAASWLAEVPRSGRYEGTKQHLMNHY